MSESALSKTVFHDRHVALGAKMVDFGGWHMPVQYATGIVKEHLACRKSAGLFDVSHMGRFTITGQDKIQFLQHSLTNNCQALDVGLAQYTIIPNKNGGAIDDAYLYRFKEDRLLLVVNAANRQKDWAHLSAIAADFNVKLADLSTQIGMLSLQGPASREIIETIIEAGPMPEPARNNLCTVTISGFEVQLGRTGYTGEPLCFELFCDCKNGPKLWDTLIENGSIPVGLGARDTLRLEAGLPLYGHEFGIDPDAPSYIGTSLRFVRLPSIFNDVWGPVMRGPSSSHMLRMSN